MTSRLPEDLLLKEREIVRRLVALDDAIASILHLCPDWESTTLGTLLLAAQREAKATRFKVERPER